MNKKELTILLLMPVIAICITYYSVHQIDTVHTNHQANIAITQDIDNYISKIKTEDPEETQKNLLNYVKNTKHLLLMELESEQLYIHTVQSLFKNTLVFSLIWFIVVLLIFYRSKRRNVI